MSALALELLESVEARGGSIRIDGQDLVISPREAAEPVLEELRRYKAELLAELARRPVMPAGVRLIRWRPVESPVRLSECSTVTNTELFIRATLRQVEARLSGSQWLTGNWTLSTLIDRLAAVGCVVEVEDARALLQ
jgi:hypothetical protein